MTSYRIVCTTIQHSNEHQHIVKAGTGTDPERAVLQWTVDRVRSAIDEGDSFYLSDDDGHIASVEPYTCDCGYETIRSAVDVTSANNLDKLRQCKWK